MRKMLWSWLFLGVALALGIFATVTLDYNQNLVLVYFFLPYFLVTLGMQYVWPEQPNQFEKGEVWADVFNNIALVSLTALQGGLVKWMSDQGSALVFQHGLLDEAWSAGNLPFWAQVLVAWLVFDFMFYVTHRLAHEVEFLWRFHSIHHSAHRLSFLNASRVHPVDIVWRRLVPMFVTYQTGVSAEAMIVTTTIGATLAVVTHLNVDFRFGPLNYLFGSNEMHRWHHSSKVEEARNFSVLMIWDHLFGTYVNPQGKARPDRMGLFNEQGYPVHSFWGHMKIPFTWKRWKASQVNTDSGDNAGQQGPGRPASRVHELV
jgi:sterol desaturase/sphingolipid hydroxylase (fatty acid hydroxylase superfamily)